MQSGCVELVWLDAERAARVVRGDRRAELAAPDFPQQADVVAATLQLARIEAAVDPDYPFGTFLVRDTAKRVIVGHVGFHGSPLNGAVEVHYAIVPSQRNRGYATAALTALIDLVRHVPGVEAVMARVARDNVPSASVLRAAGFAPLAPWRDGDEILWERIMSSACEVV